MSTASGLASTFEDDRWVPPPDLLSNYRVSGFMRAHGIDDFGALARRAAEEPEWFYPSAFSFLGLEWLRPWDRLVDESDGAPFAHWFVGGRTNLAWLACRRFAPSAVAVRWEGDDGQQREVSAGELETLVSRAGRGLRELGVGPGDVVAVYLPMVPEALISLLAIVRIGAIVAPAFSGYGSDALAERLELAHAKVLIAADGMFRRGRVSDMLPVALEAARKVSKPPTVVVVPRMGRTSAPLTGLRQWDELLDVGDDGDYDEYEAEHPCLLAFTSGSSGRPKGIVHTHGGMPYRLATELGLGMDVREGDRMCWPSDIGWLTGPSTTITPLVLGATAVLFEGVADFPAPDRIWRLVETHQLTHLGMPPTVARMLAQAGEEWVEPHSLDSLRILASTGEPWTTHAWKWLHRTVGRGRVPIINWAGGTEIGGGILSGSPVVPTPAGHFSGPSLGMSPDSVDEHGNPVTGSVGQLVVRASWPSMTRGFWADDDRYLETYWSRYDGMWLQGDWVIRYPDGTWEMPGRSDDVIKVAGKRVGPSEYESLAVQVPEVLAAAAVGIFDPVRGEVPVVAVVLADGDASDHDDVTEKVMTHVGAGVGKAMRPHEIVVLAELPLTRSGKIHRRALRAWLSGADPGDLSSLENPHIESHVREHALTQ